MGRLTTMVLKLFGIEHRSTTVVEEETHKAVDETKRLAEAFDDLNKKPDPFAALVHNMRGSSFKSRAAKGQL